MAMQSIKKAWEEFSTTIFRGQSVSNTQLREMKKAFFAGASVVLLNLAEICDSESIPDDVATAYIASIEDECEEFHKAIIREHSQRN